MRYSTLYMLLVFSKRDLKRITMPRIGGDLPIK